MASRARSMRRFDSSTLWLISLFDAAARQQGPRTHEAARAGPTNGPARQLCLSALRLRVGDDAGTLACVGQVAPERLHRERAGREGDVGRAPGRPGGDPRALVAVLAAHGLEPAAGGQVGRTDRRLRPLIGDRLTVLVAFHDAEAIKDA